MALITAEALWLVMALVAPPGWGFIAAYLLHFVPLLAAVGLSVPILRTRDRRRWLHTGMVVATADFFSLVFGAVVLLLGGSLVWRILAGAGLVVWAVVFVAFLLFLRRIAETRRRSFGDHTVDAVIVLGAGLVGDQPGPLLAARVDRGVAAAADVQDAAHDCRESDGEKNVPITCASLPLIMSGGQGPDEPVTEAFAMAMYARERHGATLQQKNLELLEEDRATNTRENLRFSIQRMGERRAGGVERGEGESAVQRRTRVGVVTSDFHVARTEMTAETVAELLEHSEGAHRVTRAESGAHGGDDARAESDARGGDGKSAVEFVMIGADTPRAARPAAYIREFVALTLWKLRGLLA